MAAYRRVYDSRHLQSSMDYLYLDRVKFNAQDGFVLFRRYKTD